MRLDRMDEMPPDFRVQPSATLLCSRHRPICPAAAMHGRAPARKATGSFLGDVMVR